MKAVVVRQFEAPLDICEMPAPKVIPGRIVVRVKALVEIPESKGALPDRALTQILRHSHQVQAATLRNQLRPSLRRDLTAIFVCGDMPDISANSISANKPNSQPQHAVI